MCVKTVSVHESHVDGAGLKPNTFQILDGDVSLRYLCLHLRELKNVSQLQQPLRPFPRVRFASARGVGWGGVGGSIQYPSTNKTTVEDDEPEALKKLNEKIAA